MDWGIPLDLDYILRGTREETKEKTIRVFACIKI